MKYLLITIMIFLTACSSQSTTNKLTDQVFTQVTGKEYSRNSSQCPTIKKQCSAGQYEEWVEESGQKACACN
ncbi:hypothetical protein A9267_18665 [Shewanella sp. UCD-FRSSP16_17]|uniref:hypothetical protein n=1 Tax=Shewanella sp. UCD-FRSSP16_17 TaxID=1853256 RepID=UPI0007EEEA49|nr:hypothetical protein [Shewanella sp. UCD-FRSSP16_17]OBT03958.1 hypothetical protein A9267_18665 [Shewanella sp. UCD-FRSSP16_17]